MILRRTTEKDPKFKIRRLAKREKIKNKEGSETAEHVMGYWPMTMRIISNFVIWPCSLIKNCQIYQNLNLFASLLASSEFSTAEKQKYLRLLDTKYSIYLIIHEENSKEMNV
jgi:hypothetical protein